MRYASLFFGFFEDRERTLAMAQASAEHAVSLDRDDANARMVLGRILAYRGEIEAAVSELETAIRINPHFARAYHGLAYAIGFCQGEAEAGLAHYETALRLSPRDPWRWISLMMKGTMLCRLGRYEEAVTSCREASRFPDSGPLPQMFLAEALGHAGRVPEAREALARAIALNPKLSAAFVREHWPTSDESVVEGLIAGLRRAGLPDEPIAVVKES